jgi:hypothetical protein
MYENATSGIISGVLSGLIILVVFCGLPFLLHFVFGIHVLPIAKDSENKEIGKVFIVAAYIILVWWYVFWIHINTITVSSDIRPQKSLAEVKQELIQTLSQFSTPKQSYSVTEKNNRVEVTWAYRLQGEQIVNSYDVEKKYIVSFELHEKKHRVLQHTSIFDSVKSKSFFELIGSWSWQGGARYEKGYQYRPSFIVENGKVKIVHQSISYGNAHVVDAGVEVIKQAGWDTTFVQFKYPISRIIFSIVGWFMILLACVLVLMGIGFLVL